MKAEDGGVNLPTPAVDVPDVSSGLVRYSTVSVNVGQEVHITTRDKIELALRKTLPDYAGLDVVVAPLSLLLGIVLAFLTADFQKELGISADAWATLFGVAGVAAFLWLLRGIYRFATRTTLDDIVSTIIAEAERPPREQ